MLIDLETWARQKFARPPCSATLRTWAKTGAIVPGAVKVGRAWMVNENAEYSPMPEIPAPAKSSRRVKNILAAK